MLPGAGEVGRLLAEHGDIGLCGIHRLDRGRQKNYGLCRPIEFENARGSNSVANPRILFLRIVQTSKPLPVPPPVGFSLIKAKCARQARVLVEASIFDEFMAAFKQAAQRYQVGDPLDPATRMGAIVDKLQYQRVLEYIADGKAHETLLLGGDAQRTDHGLLY